MAEETIRAYRNHLFGLWAAHRLGYDGGTALAYAAEVEEFDDGAAAARPMVGKVLRDFADEGLSADEDEVVGELHHLAEVSRRLAEGR